MLDKILKIKKMREQRLRRKIAQIKRQEDALEAEQQQIQQQRLIHEVELKALHETTGVMDRSAFQKLRSKLDTCFKHLLKLSEKRQQLTQEKENLQQALANEQLNLKKNLTSQEKLQTGIQDNHDSEDW